MDKERKISVVLLSNNEINRYGIASILAPQEQIDIITTASGTAASLLACCCNQPDILLTVTDRHPQRLARSLKRDLSRVSPKTKLIVISAHQKKNAIKATLDNGADDYISKDCDGGEIVSICQRVNKSLLCPSPEKESRLTSREEQMVALIAEGYTNKKSAISSPSQKGRLRATAKQLTTRCPLSPATSWSATPSITA